MYIDIYKHLSIYMYLYMQIYVAEIHHFPKSVAPSGRFEGEYLLGVEPMDLQWHAPGEARMRTEATHELENIEI